MTVVSVQAPVGGINRYDSVDDMPAEDAIILDNWVPDAGFCRMRGGSLILQNYGTDPIGTLIPYGQKFIVATGDKIIDSGFSPGDPLPIIGAPVTLGSGFGNSRWDWEVSNNNLILVNGADAPQQYDGTALTPVTFTAGITTPEDIIGVGMFKGRAIYWKDEPGFYFAQAGSYAGELSYFDLSPFVSKLSKLKIHFTWSIDANDGVDDYAVFIFDSGECLVYQGTDPGDIDFWALVGAYTMGEPLTIRSHAHIAGDQIILTRQGWENFRTIWDTGDLRDAGIGQKVTGLATDSTRFFSNNPNWEAHFYPEERFVLINVPQGSGTSVQHIMNTNTFAWSTFSGWNAETFGEYLGEVYFGDSDGNVHIAQYGTDDNGTPIITDALPAWNSLGSKAQQKLMTAIRPITDMVYPEDIAVTGSSDFAVPDRPETYYRPTPSTASPWGSPWGSAWATSPQQEAQGQWVSVNADGYACTYRMSTETTGQALRWASTAIMYKTMGIM